MEILGVLGVIAAFIGLALLMNLRGHAWQDFVDRISKDKDKDDDDKD